MIKSFFSILVALAACFTITSCSGNSDSSNSSQEATQHLVDGASTPEEAVQAVMDALKNHNVDAALCLACDRKGRKLAEDEKSELKKFLETSFNNPELQAHEFKSFEIVDSKTYDNDKNKVRIKLKGELNNGEKDTKKITCYKNGDGWYVKF